jgi:hypothetical protein
MSAGGGKRAYSQQTVLRAQRRVLKMLAGYIEKKFKPDTLYTDGAGLMSGSELLAHVTQAANLKVRRPR